MSDVCLSPPESLCSSFPVSASPEVCPQHFSKWPSQTLGNCVCYGEASRSGFHHPKSTGSGNVAAPSSSQRCGIKTLYRWECDGGWEAEEEEIHRGGPKKQDSVEEVRECLRCCVVAGGPVALGSRSDRWDWSGGESVCG